MLAILLCKFSLYPADSIIIQLHGKLTHGDRFCSVGQESVPMPWLSKENRRLPRVQASRVAAFLQSSQAKQFIGYMPRYFYRSNQIYHVIFYLPYSVARLLYKRLQGPMDGGVAIYTQFNIAGFPRTI